MQYFKLPAALRWAWVNCLFLLVMMTAYRLLLLEIFSVVSMPKAAIAFKGILYDAGVVAFIGTLFILLTTISSLHPYKSGKGLMFSLIYFSFFVFLLGIVYTLDLISIKTFGQRVTGTRILSLFQGNPRKGAFFGNFPIMTILVGFTLIIWIWWWLISWLHTTLGMLSRAEEKGVRLIWYGFTMFIFFLTMFFSISNTINLPTKSLHVGKAREIALIANPVLTLILK